MVALHNNSNTFISLSSACSVPDKHSIAIARNPVSYLASRQEEASCCSGCSALVVSKKTMTTAADAAESNNPQAGQGRPLPKKESDLFKNVVKFYESKQYKKGIKNADTILKRFPNHGETLCMKGLIVNAMANAFFPHHAAGDGGGGGGGGDGVDKKKEAVELVKKGLMMDMR